MGRLFLFSLLCMIINKSWCHLCLVFPEQRGAMDITTSGSSTCFRHGAECGGQQPETPGVTPYMGASQMWIKIQQNFNHYEVGFPGYMDIALAPLNSTDFKMLAYTPDYYVHAQDHQQNFTTIVILPNIDCDHCVLRARYNPHKPGETTFYQCADIKIKKSQSSSSKRFLSSLPPLSQNLDPQYRNVQKKFQRLKYRHSDGPNTGGSYLMGLSYNDFQRSFLNIVNISFATGYPYAERQYDLNIAFSNRDNHMNHKQKSRQYISGGSATTSYLYDAIGAINTKGNMVNIVHNGNPDDVSDIFVEFDLIFQGQVKRLSTLSGIGASINAIIPYADDKYYVFSIQEATKSGEYMFVIGNLQMTKNSNDSVYTSVIKSQSEDLYINFQWAEYDPTRNMIYILMGNENSPDKLLARIYAFNLYNQSYVVTEVDVSQYTFMSMHVDPQSGKMYAVSPGLFYGSNTEWFLIEVDPFTGKSECVMKIADFGYFAKYYGGSVFNGISPNGILYHTFRLYDTNADIIVAIDLTKKSIRFSEITNLRSVHNLALVNLK